MNVCTHMHALAQTVGGTWRISKDVAVVCADSSLHTKPGGRRNKKMDQLLVRKVEREQKLSGKNTLLIPRTHGDCGIQLLTAPLGETCQYPVLFFMVCFIYLRQKRRSAVLIALGVQLDTNVNQLEEKQLALKVLSLFST